MTTKEQEKKEIIEEELKKAIGRIIAICNCEDCEADKEFFKASLERLYEKGREDEKKAWINGERCASCGELMKASDTYDTCPKCWEEE